jgi:hypothetical protein
MKLLWSDWKPVTMNPNGDETGLPRDRRLASITLELDVDEVASIEASF